LVTDDTGSGPHFDANVRRFGVVAPGLARFAEEVAAVE
jgi:hypothetical protein